MQSHVLGEDYVKKLNKFYQELKKNYDKLSDEKKKKFSAFSETLEGLKKSIEGLQESVARVKVSSDPAEQESLRAIFSTFETNLNVLENLIHIDKDVQGCYNQLKKQQQIEFNDLVSVLNELRKRALLQAKTPIDFSTYAGFNENQMRQAIEMDYLQAYRIFEASADLAKTLMDQRNSKLGAFNIADVHLLKNTIQSFNNVIDKSNSENKDEFLANIIKINKNIEKADYPNRKKWEALMIALVVVAAVLIPASIAAAFFTGGISVVVTFAIIGLIAGPLAAVFRSGEIKERQMQDRKKVLSSRLTTFGQNLQQEEPGKVEDKKGKVEDKVKPR